MDGLSFAVTEDDRADDLPKAFRPKANEFMADGRDAQQVVITGLKVPFWDLTWNLTKMSLAAVPAIIIFSFVLVGLAELLTTTFPALVKLKVLIYAPV